MNHATDGLSSNMNSSSASSTTSWSTLISSNSATNDDTLSFSSLTRTRLNSNSYAPSTPQLNFKPIQQSSPLQALPPSHLTTSPFPQRVNTANSLFLSNSNSTSINSPLNHSSSYHPQSPVTHQTHQLLPLPQQTQRPLWQQPPPPLSAQLPIQQQHRPLLPIGMPPLPHPQPLQQQQTQPIVNQFQSNDAWLLAEMTAMLRQNQQQQTGTFNTNVTLSTAAQQILATNTNNNNSTNNNNNNYNNNNNNNRPLRSEKIDIEIIKHLIREARWKRRCGMKKEVNEYIYFFLLLSIMFRFVFFVVIMVKMNLSIQVIL